MSPRKGWPAVLLAAVVMPGATVAALAVPASAHPTGGADTANTVTMVNGAGRRITIPVAVGAAARRAAANGYTPANRSAGGAIKFGMPGPSTRPAPTQVVGNDDRVQESVPNTYPWFAIAHLSTNIGGCTGFMLSRDVLVTAGHCVYSGGYATSYTVAPGRQGTSTPYGTCSGGINDVWTNDTYRTTGSADHDYGLIKLTCDIGNTTGWFGWWYDMGETLTGISMYIEGYPGDKPYGTMWWDSDPISSQTSNRLFYSIDTAGGQSGAPIYHYNSTSAGLCGGWCITGIHKGASGSQNHGTRFNPSVMSFINYWIGQP